MRKSGVRVTLPFLKYPYSSFLSSPQIWTSSVTYEKGGALFRGFVLSLCAENFNDIKNCSIHPLTRGVTEGSTEFDSFEMAENGSQTQLPSLEDDIEEDLPGQDPYGDEDEDLAIRPLSE